MVDFNAKSHNEFLDSLWDWDTYDYKSKFMHGATSYIELLNTTYETYQKPSAVLLMHDFDTNHHLFDVTMYFLQTKQCNFKRCFAPS